MRLNGRNGRKLVKPLFALGGQFGQLVHCFRIAFARGSIQQDASLLAASRNAFAGDVQIGERNGRSSVTGLKRAPEPLRSRCRILRDAGTSEVLLRAKKFRLRRAFREGSG